MKRINLVTCVRSALIERGISTLQVVNAVNSALGELEKIKSTSKLGQGTVQLKKGTYKVTDTVAAQYQGTMTAPLHFDAWHCKIEAACKVAEIESIGIPEVFNEWLEKMTVKEEVPK